MSPISEEDRRKTQAEQIIRAARDGGSVYIKNGKATQTTQAGNIDFDLLRSSGALVTSKRQACNAKRLMSALWRYLTKPLNR